MTFMLQAVASVLSCRLILHLRAFASEEEFGRDLMTMSFGPARTRSIVFVAGDRSGLVDSSASLDSEAEASMGDSEESAAR